MNGIAFLGYLTSKGYVLQYEPFPPWLLPVFLFLIVLAPLPAWVVLIVELTKEWLEKRRKR